MKTRSNKKIKKEIQGKERRTETGKLTEIDGCVYVNLC